MIKVGRTYIAYGQGMTITPHRVPVRVVWVDGENVHYKKDGSTTVEQTTLARFEEIITPKE